MSLMTITIRDAQQSDQPAIASLFPRLAAFDIPHDRLPEQLYQGDLEHLAEWLSGEEFGCSVLVAESAEEIAGVVVIRLREEMLSGAPSAHVEVLAVDEKFIRQGLGKRLMQCAEDRVLSQGAESVTLHVFAVNHTARALYESLGYSGELLRYRKLFETGTSQ
ncbi:MAG: ribosomal protein S18 acetylase RimI-like enzyme [Gammaproteobacteria bacterium]